MRKIYDIYLKPATGNIYEKYLVKIKCPIYAQEIFDKYGVSSPFGGLKNKT